MGPALAAEQWINGHYGNTLYNHYYPPNPVGKWDCGNASHNKGSDAPAGAYHTGGVNVLARATGRCDSSTTAFDLATGGAEYRAEGKFWATSRVKWRIGSVSDRRRPDSGRLRSRLVKMAV